MIMASSRRHTKPIWLSEDRKSLRWWPKYRLLFMRSDSMFTRLRLLYGKLPPFLRRRIGRFHSPKFLPYLHKALHRNRSLLTSLQAQTCHGPVTKIAELAMTLYLRDLPEAEGVSDLNTCCLASSVMLKWMTWSMRPLPTCLSCCYRNWAQYTPTMRVYMIICRCEMAQLEE